MAGTSPVMKSMADGKTRVRATAKLSHLKFMQKAAAKAKLAAAPAAQADNDATTLAGAIASGPPGKDAEHWSTAHGQQNTGCRVITEDAPPPGALLGRISFGSFNPTVDALQAASESAQSTVAATTAAAAEEEAAAKSLADTSSNISDAAMAAALSSNRQKAPEGDTRSAETANNSARRAEAARSEAMASMTGIARGPEHIRLVRPSPAATTTGNKNEGSTGVLSLNADAGRPGKPSHNSGQKKKQGRGLREGEEDIAPLRLPKRKKHGR